MNEVSFLTCREGSKSLHAINALFLLTCLMLPISSSVKSIALTMAILLIISVPENRKTVFALFNTSWAWALTAFFVFILMGCLWSPASFSEKGLMVEKISKLLYLPFLVLVFRDKAMRRAGFHAFILGMAVVSSVAVLSYEHWFFIQINSDHVFRNHILMGLMGAFAAFLSAHFAMQTKSYIRWGYVALVVLFSWHVLWVNEGRTGYVLYALFALLWLWRCCTFRQMLAGLLLLGSLMGGIYTLSPVMHTRVNSVVSDLKAYDHVSKDTPVGFRLSFHGLAKTLFLEHPLLGQGTGGFFHYTRQHNPFPKWDGHRLVEPHSQYWLILSEGGMIGLAFLLFFYASIYWRTKSNPIAEGLLAAFLVSQFTDSMLFYSSSGFFFLMIMAICLGESYENSI